jgi:cytochrome o ubiquinol oxidase operon protein cyoD
MSKLKPIVSRHESEYGSFKTYLAGFLISIVLTLSAYLTVQLKGFTKTSIVVAIIVGFALLQLIAQLFLFLHLGKETKPRWKLFVLLFVIVVILILVFGSLWIMNNLNYRMTPSQILNYLNNQGGGF